MLWEIVKLKVTEQTLIYAKANKLRKYMRKQICCEKKKKKKKKKNWARKLTSTLQMQMNSGRNNADEKLAINIQLEEKTRN